ncbi:hypothetical protein [Niveibacterium sp.]|uniref:hypothetical protein n=1 Tax=Niveibacterium sp. TaxID=2017444 RepID=UPI0035B326F6
MSAFLPFLAIVIYVSLLVIVFKKVKNGWIKWVGALIWVLVPTADEVVGRYVLQTKLCPESGLRVFHRGDKEGGLYISSSAPSEGFLRTYGFPFVEGRSGDGTYLRLSFVEGRPVQIEMPAPAARYELTGWSDYPVDLGIFGALLGENLPNENRHAGGFGGNEYRLIDRQTGQVMARFRGYGFNGGWAARTLSMLAGGVGGGTGCERRYREDLTSTMVERVFSKGGTEK